MKRRELYLVSEHPAIGALLDKCYELNATTPWFSGRAEHQLKLAQAKEPMWDAIMKVHYKTTGITGEVDISIRDLKGYGKCFFITYEVDKL
jgi:hypothetical protein